MGLVVVTAVTDRVGVGMGMGEGRITEMTVQLTLALRNGPITRVPGFAGLRQLSLARRVLLGGKVVGERGN